MHGLDTRDRDGRVKVRRHLDWHLHLGTSPFSPMHIAMARSTLVLLKVLLIVRAHSRPLSTGLASDVRRDLVGDFLDDDFLYTYSNTHDGYETFSFPETTTFPFGGLFPDESQTRTDSQTQTTATAATTSTTTHGTHHPTIANPTAAPSTIVTPTPTTSLPSASPSSGPDAAEAASMPSGEGKQWKIIGLIVICITFVGGAILTIVFFDAWWGFLRALVCQRRRGGGKEDMVPDWGTCSWEYKLPSPSEDGYRYPGAASSDNIKREMGEGNGGGMGMGMGTGTGRGGGTGPELLVNPFDSHPRGLLVSPQPFYDPHPLEPLARRPSANVRSPHGFP